MNGARAPVADFYGTLGGGSGEPAVVLRAPPAPVVRSIVVDR